MGLNAQPQTSELDLSRAGIAARPDVGAGWSSPALRRQVIAAGGYCLLFAWFWLIIVLEYVEPDYVLHLQFATIFAGYAVHLAVQRRLPGPTPFDLPLAAMALVFSAAIIAAPYRDIALESSLVVAAPVLMLYVLHDLRFFSLDALPRLLLAVLIVLSVGALVSAGGLYVDRLQLVSAVQGGLSASDLLPSTLYRTQDLHHSTVLALMLVACLPFALALVLRPASRPERLLAALALSFGLGALLFTGSRGAWLAFLVAAPLVLLLYRPRSPDSNLLPQLEALLRDHTKLIAAAAVLSLLLGVLATATLLQVRPAWLFRDTATPRLEMARISLEIIAERPLLGSGPDSHSLLYLARGGDEGAGIWHPHSSYLDILSGTGLAGLAAFAALTVVAAVVLRRALRQEDPRRRALAAACIAAASTPFVTGLFEVTLHYVAVMLLLAVVFVIALRLAPPAAPRRTPASMGPRLMVVALIPLLLYSWAAMDSTLATLEDGNRALEQRRLADAAVAARKAVDADPSSIAYQLNAGVVEALVYRGQLAGGNPDAGTLERAVAHLRRAAALDPNGFLAYANLAQALRMQDDAPAAAEAARRSLQLSPDDYGVSRWEVDPSIAVAAGTVFEWGGYTDEAVAAYARALHLDPTLSQSSFWSDNPARREILPRAVEASGLPACELGRYAALYGSNALQLQSLTASCRATLLTATDRTSLAMMLEAGGLHAEALAEAEAAGRASDGSPEAHTALGFVLAQSDLAKARRHLIDGDHDASLLLARTYEAGATSAPPPSAVLRNLEPLASGKSLGRAHFKVALRRPAPPVVLIPGEWQQLQSPRLAQSSAILARHPLEPTGTPVYKALLVLPTLAANPGVSAVVLAAGVLLALASLRLLPGRTIGAGAGRDAAPDRASG